jgi:hypothetical protein
MDAVDDNNAEDDEDWKLVLEDERDSEECKGVKTPGKWRLKSSEFLRELCNKLSF